MIDVRGADRAYRGGEPAAGIDSRYAFSFGAHYDPDNLRFGPLTACNEERLAPGAGFAAHGHRGVEIVTWVIEGELEHRDDTGRTGRVRPGEVQWLSAGTGVRHTERNAGTTQPCRFLQMWLEPSRPGGAPAYGVARGTPVRPPGLPAAALHAFRDAAVLPPAPLRYLHVVRGEVELAGRRLGAGDAARITGEPQLAAGAAPGAEYLVWTLPLPAAR